MMTIRCSSGAQVARDEASASSSSLPIVVSGGTGYIGRFVVRELAARGHQVVALTRRKSGIGGAKSIGDVEQGLNKDAGDGSAKVEVRAADVTSDSVDALASEITASGFTPAAAVCCLASRTGGVKDSWLVDYEATKRFMEASVAAGATHFVLLSAICVQRPTLEFQRAKLRFEADLKALAEHEGSTLTYSIVRPTAFFKSLAAQVDVVKKGGPYVMFGDGELASCKPISEADLARFIADCVTDESYRNKVLPIGGPGKALSAKEQGDILFRLLDKKPFYFPVPVALFDGINGMLRAVNSIAPQIIGEDVVEFGNIGKYYAVESMLVWDDERQCYDADATPSYGTDTLEEFYRRALFEDGMVGQELGDQGGGIFN